MEPDDKELRILGSLIGSLSKYKSSIDIYPLNLVNPSSNNDKRLKSKHKVDRRLKANLWGRPKSPFNVVYLQDNMVKTKREITDYGINFDQTKT